MIATNTILKSHFRKIQRLRFSSARKSVAWPFIDRPLLNSTISQAISDSSPRISWIVGGEGSGKTQLLIRSLMVPTKSKDTNIPITISIDFKSFRKSELTKPENFTRTLSKLVGSTLAQQLQPQRFLQSLRDTGIDVDSVIRVLADTKPLWSHLARTSKSVDDLWARIAPSSSIASDCASSIRLDNDPETELRLWLSAAKSSGKKVVVTLCHIEHIECNLLRNSSAAILMDPEYNFKCLIECNDSLKTIWNVCGSGDDHQIIQVPDLPKEAVRALFVPALLSDDVHVDLVYSMCGGRVGLLEKLVAPLNVLNEEQRLLDQEQEQRYRSGKEIRPSTESKELQVDPLIFKREVSLRESMIDGALNPDALNFDAAMRRMLTEFGPLEELRESMAETEFNVVVGETIRLIVSKLAQSSYLAIPAGHSPLDIAHPVVLGLMDANILMINWLPTPRLMIESPLKLFLLEAWYAARLESQSLTERAHYNLLMARNKLHFEKQLEKLVS